MSDAKDVNMFVDAATQDSIREMTQVMFLTPEQRYAEFLRSKEHRNSDAGKRIAPEQIHPILFPFQRDIVQWAARKGRAAIFADCGMGKTFCQLEWARHTGNRVLILCPLSVAQQTIAEGEKIGLTVRFCDRPVDEDGIWITNYQKLKHFIGARYDAIVLDESSILKSLDGKTRDLLIKEFQHISQRLCCTATPSPNDIAELANHAEFLGIMTRVEMLSQFFVHDQGGEGTVGNWRLKGHAQEAFWKWVATWAVYVRSPADLGYPDDQFKLPPFHIQEEKVQSVYTPEGELFPRLTAGITGRSQARKATLTDRVVRSAEIIKQSTEQWVVWCNLNDEGQQLHKLLPDSVLIEGATPDDLRVEYEHGWRRGDVRILITKPQQYGHGLNWQHCHNVLYLGLSDSFEQYYQSVRRCWRFGQKDTVNVVIVTSTAEYAIVQNIKKKEQQAAQLAAGIVRYMKDAMIEEIHHQADVRDEYATGETSGRNWRLLLGDSVERAKELEDRSVGLSVFSPPFASLYTYSPLSRDMGNAKNYDEFFAHFRFLIPELLRVTMPGRRACVHVQQVATTKVKDGVIGWRDFRADVVRHFMGAGWIYDGEIVIDKDPQAQAIRTKSKALMFVQKNKDSAWCRPAMADYILLFRKDGENDAPIVPDVSNEEWIQWARPIWYGIKESNTLNAAEARERNDEKHICPLQLETIERCIRLWSNPGELVFDPFTGIASTGHEAIRLKRKFIGCELKESYWKVGQKNLRQAESLQSNLLFN